MKKKFWSVLLIICIGLLVSSVPAFAWDIRWLIEVPREDAGRPGPIVDGLCGVEYQNGWRSTKLFYRPRVNLPPASLYMVSTEDALYVCLVELQLALGETEPFVSLAFDTMHNGGRVPQNDDLRFVLTESGTAEASRGNGGGGFIPDDTITGWEAVMYKEWGGGDIPLYWNAEFRIPFTLLGGGDPSTTIGFHVRHNWLQYQADDYVWPITAGWNVPNTWGTLEWLISPSEAGHIFLDEFRITQGLELDAGTTYKFIAGKDVLVRSQLYTDGSELNVDRVRCQVTRYYPSVSTTYTVFANGVPAPRLNQRAYGYFNGGPVFNCWIPGEFISEPGSYAFKIEVDPVWSPEFITLKNDFVRAYSTADLRLFFWGWENKRSGVPNARPWDDDLTAALAYDVWEFQRMFPVQEGVEIINTANKGTAGLRYLLAASNRFCDDSTSGCDYLRAEANDAFLDFNSRLAALEESDGVPRDRFDWGSLLEATTSTGGGQSCSPGHRVAGSGFDANVAGASASVVFQEVAHCMGQVRPASPNTTPGMHSVNRNIPLFRSDWPVVNMLNRSDIPDPLSVMYPYVENVPNTFIEGWEWNDLRSTLLTMPRPSRMNNQIISQEQPLFHFVGMIDEEDNVSVIYTKRVDDLPLELSSDFPDSPYKLVLLDASNNVLGSLQFEVEFESTHGSFDNVSLVLTTLLPENSARFELRNGSQILFGQDFSSESPIVSNVVATSNGQGGIDLSWDASDVDSTNLNFNIYFLSEPDGIPLLIASGLTGNTYFYPTKLSPATNNGYLVVEATDGYNTVQTTSNPFTIDDKPPAVVIASPEQDANLVAGQYTMLNGVAYDYTTGILSDDALTWDSNLDGDLGKGSSIEAQLSPGVHILTLSAVAPSGLSSSVSVDVTVMTDSDGDGLPNSYENTYSCLDDGLFDSDIDPDGDSLASYGEWVHGTDACEADTDLDGVGDGDEVRGNSDPLDENSQPQPNKVHIFPTSVNLGACPSTSVKTLPVQAASDIIWKVTSDWEGITVVGGGQGDGQITISADCKSLLPGEQIAKVLVSAEGNQSQIVEVKVVGGFNIFLPITRR